METLVIGTDGSEVARDAGAAGLAILQPCRRVLVVSVAEGPDPDLADDATGHAGPSMTPEEFEKRTDAARTEGQAAVASMVSELRDRGIATDGMEAVVITGEPGPALCQLARDEDAGAIVVGSRGRGGVKRMLLGSVSDYVVRNAPCPVVVTR